MVAVVGETEKFPLTTDENVALVIVSDCAPAAAVLRTVMVAVPVAGSVALGEAGTVDAHVGGVGLTTPFGGGGTTHVTLAGLICSTPAAVSVQPDSTFRYTTFALSGTFCVPVTLPTVHGCVGKVKFEAMVTVYVVTFVAAFVLALVMNAALSPIVIFVVPGSAFAT